MTPACRFPRTSLGPLIILVLGVHATNGNLIRTSNAADSTTQIQVQEGDRIDLDCFIQIESLTSCFFHWFHNNRLVRQAPLNMSDLDPVHGQTHATVVSQLVKCEAKLSDSGDYICVVSCNSEDPKSQSPHYSVTVQPSQTKNSLPDSAVESDHPVQIYLWTSQILEVRNTDVIIACRATQGSSFKSPTIEWKFNGQLVTENMPGVIEIHDNGDLELTTLMDFHLSDLVCIATGTDGSVDSRGVFVYLLYA